MIGDLGLAKSMESSASFAGTLAYMGPEFFRNEEIGYFSDIW